MGTFYGQTEFNSVKFLNGNIIPYSPQFKVSTIYSFPKISNFLISAELKFYGKSFGDIDNKVSINSFIDLGGKIKYFLFENLSINAEIQNILNKDNYIWNNYKEKPFDLILGLTYEW